MAQFNLPADKAELDAWREKAAEIRMPLAAVIRILLRGWGNGKVALGPLLGDKDEQVQRNTQRP